MEDKILLKHPAEKKGISMARAKYDVLKSLLLEHLKSKGESTFTDIWKSAEQGLQKQKIPFEGSVQWHMEWVKLDLEANHLIERVTSTSPQKYRLSE
jgi:hypothetical protein